MKIRASPLSPSSDVRRHGCAALRTARVAVILGVASVAIPLAAANLPAEWAKTPENDTIFTLLPGPGGKSLMVDAAGRYSVQVTGGKTASDARMGSCVVFGDEEKNGIQVKDLGEAEILQGGVTFEAWLQLDQPMPKEPKAGATLGMKVGSFCWSLTAEGKVNNTWLCLPSVPVATDQPNAYKTYPVGVAFLNGEMELPVGQWVHLVITYNDKTRTFRSWIDGGLDRDRQFALEGPQPLDYQRGAPFVFLQGVKNCRVAGIRLRSGAHDPPDAPLMSCFVNQLPWEDKILVTLDRMADPLKFPLEAAVIIQAPSGATKTISRTRIAAGPTAHIEFPISKMAWNGTMCLVIVRVYSENRQVFTSTCSVVQAKPGAAVALQSDRSLSVNDRPFFPRIVYHVFPEDLPQVASLGFNLFFGRDHKLRFLSQSGSTDEDLAARRESMDQGLKDGVFTAMTANYVFGYPRQVEALKKHPGLLCWYSFDEPWGRLERLVDTYNMLRLADPDHPVFMVQNNRARFQETAQGCDILGCDPYPIPNVSLRDVADATREAVKAAYGRKPVWTILPTYAYKSDNKIPTLEELRCMIYLALCEGANGIGIYAWDDRPKKMEGWYMKEHPEALKAVASAMGEVKALERILLAPNSKDAVAFTPKNPCLHASVKQIGDKRYLFLANDSRSEESGTLVVNGVNSATAHPLPETGFNQALEFTNGRAAVKLPRLAAAAFELGAKETRPAKR